MKKIIVAIDGPAGSGKSTTAKRVAERLGYVYIDTGAMYRAITLAAIRASAEMGDAPLGRIAEESTITMEPSEAGQRVFLNGEDVTKSIRSAEVTGLVSTVSTFPSVRRALVQRQRMIGLNGGVVMDGRDIGSVVFPHAEVKVFLIADPEERVRRRLAEARMSNEAADENVIRHQILDRDRLDSERADSPLVQAADAVRIDTTSLTIDQQVNAILDLVHGYGKAYDLVSAFGGF